MKAYSAIVCFAGAAVLGYALHRLALSIGEPDPRTVGPSVHVALYWRAATALWWGALAAVAGWRFPAIGAPVARALPWLVAVAVGIAVLVP